MDAERNPFTQNTSEFATARDAWLSRNMHECAADTIISSACRMQDQSQPGETWVPLLNPGWKYWREKDLARPYDREMIVMAEVWAYFHIACEVRGVLLIMYRSPSYWRTAMLESCRCSSHDDRVESRRKVSTSQ